MHVIKTLGSPEWILPRRAVHALKWLEGVRIRQDARTYREEQRTSLLRSILPEAVLSNSGLAGASSTAFSLEHEFPFLTLGWWHAMHPNSLRPAGVSCIRDRNMVTEAGGVAFLREGSYSGKRESIFLPSSPRCDLLSFISRSADADLGHVPISYSPSRMFSSLVHSSADSESDRSKDTA